MNSCETCAHEDKRENQEPCLSCLILQEHGEGLGCWKAKPAPVTPREPSSIDAALQVANAYAASLLGREIEPPTAGGEAADVPSVKTLLAERDRLRSALKALLAGDLVGALGHGGEDRDRFYCEFCKASHLAYDEIPHTPECPVTRARSALACAEGSGS
jgi:hypothetical protein